MEVQKIYDLSSISLTQGNRWLEYTFRGNRTYIHYRYKLEKDLYKDIPFERYYKAKEKWHKSEYGYMLPSIHTESFISFKTQVV